MLDYFPSTFRIVCDTKYTSHFALVRNFFFSSVLRWLPVIVGFPPSHLN